jgi:uncharacterized protein (UPF0218 family)
LDVVIARGAALPKYVHLVLPEVMRDELKVPLGPVVDEQGLTDRPARRGPLCTVGDMTTETVHRLGLPIKLAIVDYQTKRSPDPRWVSVLSDVGDRTVEVTNPPAMISRDMYNGVLEAWTSPGSTKMVVTGEEDMASLPAILHAPEGATVIYGIPDTGLCLVQVDERARAVVTDVLERLDVRWARPPPQGGRQDGT